MKKDETLNNLLFSHFFAIIAPCCIDISLVLFHPYPFRLSKGRFIILQIPLESRIYDLRGILFSRFSTMQHVSTTGESRISEMELLAVLQLSAIGELTQRQRYIIRSILPHLSFGEDGQLKIVGKKKHRGHLRISSFTQMLVHQKCADIEQIL